LQKFVWAGVYVCIVVITVGMVATVLGVLTLIFGRA
tara:strand:+ start:191 stop:298 length:108 start_codon:yes stop_codon:yes gene_type:complete